MLPAPALVESTLNIWISSFSYGLGHAGHIVRLVSNIKDLSTPTSSPCCPLTELPPNRRRLIVIVSDGCQILRRGSNWEIRRAPGVPNSPSLTRLRHLTYTVAADGCWLVAAARKPELTSNLRGEPFQTQALISVLKGVMLLACLA